jgi:hypothetical protein
MKYLHSFLLFSNRFDISPLFAVYLSVINMEGAYIRLGSIGGTVPFAGEKEKVLFPGILIEDISYTVNIHDALRSTFDMLYQSCGASSCPSYTPDGTFNLDYIEEQ